jgi:hypothetical protein
MRLYAAAAEPPNWADKLEAWSTFGGAVLTAVAVIVAFLVWRHDRWIRREDKHAADAAQARLVAVKIEALYGSPRAGWIGVQFSVLNNSPNVVSDTSVSIGFGSWSDQDPKPQESYFLGDFTAGEQRQSRVHFGERKRWPYDEGTEADPLVDWLDQVDGMIVFTDGMGLRWRREIGKEPARVERSDELVPSVRQLAQALLIFNPVRTLWVRVSQAIRKTTYNFLAKLLAKQGWNSRPFEPPPLGPRSLKYPSVPDPDLGNVDHSPPLNEGDSNQEAAASE